MLDRLPLELIERIVFDPSPWTCADSFAFLSAVSKRYQEIFRPYARRYLVVRSARTYKFVQTWTMKRRRLVKTLLVGPPGLDTLSYRNSSLRADVEGGLLHPEDVPRLLGLLSSVESVLIRRSAGIEYFHADRELEVWDSYEVPIVISANSPFRNCRSLVIDNTETDWEIEESLGARSFALEHLTLQVSDRAHFFEPLEIWSVLGAGAFPNLKTLNIQLYVAQPLPVHFLDQLDYMQAEFAGGRAYHWDMPREYRQTKTPILYTALARLSDRDETPDAAGVQYVTLERDLFDQPDCDIAGFLQPFADLRAVFIPKRRCDCKDRSIAEGALCAVHTAADQLRKRGVDVCWTTWTMDAPIDPYFIDYLKRKPHVPPPQRDPSSEASPSP